MKRKRKAARTAKAHVRKDDIVVALAGADAVAGKSGKVLRVYPAQGRALVEGFNFVHKHMRKTQDDPKGGIIQKEAPVALSNLRKRKASEGEEKG